MTATETGRTIETHESYHIRLDWHGTKMFSREGYYPDEASARAVLAELTPTSDMDAYVERITVTTTTITERLDP